MTTYSISDVVAEIRKVAAAAPDHIYDQDWDPHKIAGCVYVRDGQPSCIVGHALWNLGLIDASIEHSVRNYMPAPGILPTVTVPNPFKSGDARWVWTVQAKQDRGYRWADAVAEADREQGLVERVIPV